MPGRSGEARWNCSSAAMVRPRSRARLSGCTNQSRSIATTRPPALQGVQQAAQPLGAEGDSAGQRPHPHPGAAGVADVLFDDGLGASLGEQAHVRHQCAGALSLKRGGAMSSSVPPPIVTIGEYERMTKRSPGSATSGASSRKRANADRPGGSSDAIEQQHARHDLAGPRVDADTITALQRARGLGATARAYRPRARRAPACRRGRRTLPRSTAARSTPWRFIAVRCPALDSVTVRLCVCRPRILACTPAGNTSTRSSTRSRPAISVPVMTVPKPLIVNTRSMGSRGS